MPSTPNYVGLLELALAKPNGPNVATPFDNPIPWRWETWRDVTDGAVAPWLEEATEEKKQTMRLKEEEEIQNDPEKHYGGS